MEKEDALELKIILMFIATGFVLSLLILQSFKMGDRLDRIEHWQVEFHQYLDQGFIPRDEK